jgi:hypothetical protein
MLLDMRAFYETSRRLVTPRRRAGSEAILDSWRQLAAGESSPGEGLVLSF